ncbi:MAG: hypothetical protein AAAFM81_05875 [Pseudomonadota bacterium]
MSKTACIPVIAAALCVLGFGSTGAVAQDGGSGLPEWLQKELDREVKRRGKSRSVELFDGMLSSTVKAKEKIESVAYDWGEGFLVNFGSKNTPAECYAYDGDSNSATLLSNIAEVGIQNVLEANGASLKSRTIQSVIVDHVGAQPIMALEWFLIIEKAEGEQLAAQTKAAVAVIDKTSVACIHTEMGYSKSFLQMFVEFVENASTSTDDISPYYQELYLVQLNDQAVGFAKMDYVRDEEGDSRIVSVESSAFAADRSTLSTSDGYSYEWSTPQGGLINAYSANVENGELTMQLDLSRDENDIWGVKGNIQGKEYATELPDVSTIESGLRQIQTVRDVIGDAERTEGDLIAWIPDADPAALTRVTFNQDEDNMSGTLSLGPLVMKTKIAGDGTISEMASDLGGMTMTMTRVWSEGEVPPIE